MYDTEGIIKIAEYYESLISDDPEYIKKSRYKQFEKGEFKRRFIGGMKSAATVEEYAEAGNIIMFVADSYRVQEQIHTTNELSEFLEKYAADVTADVTFRYRDVISPHKRGRGVGIDFSKLPEYYVIACKQSYFRKITSRRVHYNPDPCYAKKFVRQADAERYLKKYSHILDNGSHCVLCIPNGGAK